MGLMGHYGPYGLLLVTMGHYVLPLWAAMGPMDHYGIALWHTMDLHCGAL